MKNSNDNATPRDREALQTRLALRLTAGLTELCAKRSTPDIDERLRVARRQALERAAAARHAAPAHASRVGMRGAVLAGRGTRPQDEERTPWWLRLAALLPLVMLIAGLALIQQIYQRDQIVAAAEIDAALLTDDLPPSAYADPGFAAFLKTPPQE